MRVWPIGTRDIFACQVFFMGCKKITLKTTELVVSNKSFVRNRLMSIKIWNTQSWIPTCWSRDEVVIIVEHFNLKRCKVVIFCVRKYLELQYWMIVPPRWILRRLDPSRSRLLAWPQVQTRLPNHQSPTHTLDLQLGNKKLNHTVS